MKRMIKIAILIISLVNIKNVSAITPKVIYMENIYSNRVLGEQKMNGKLGYIYINGQIAFCIDPFRIIGNEYSTQDELYSTLYTEEEKRQISLIIHYGAGTHPSNPYYYMATQELIWRIKGEGDYYFTTSDSFEGERINVETYKEEILKKVSSHNLLPSFSDTTVIAQLYDDVYLRDENNVINYYQLSNSSKNKISKKENGLSIKFLDENSTELVLNSKTVSGSSSHIYVGNGQNLLTASLDEEKTTVVHLKTEGVSYYLNIQFLENNQSIFGKVKFKIYNCNTSQFIENGKIYESNYFGDFHSDFKLELGTYEISYVEIPNGYIAPLMSNKITLDENLKVNSKYEYEWIHNLEVPRGHLTLYRTAIHTNNSAILLNDIEYKIYASSDIYDVHSKMIYKKDELVDIRKIQNGQLDIDLPLGSYYIVEGVNSYNIPTLPKQFISFGYKDSITDIYYEELHLVTPMLNQYFNIDTKIELLDGNYIPCNNCQYELYASEDIYYLNDLVYTEGTLIRILTSNEDGMIHERIGLPYGKYSLREIRKDIDYEEIPNQLIEFNQDKTEIYLNYIKKLKRGNLSITIKNRKENMLNTLKFLYDKEYDYAIENNLILESLKVGNYTVIYDKEYPVTILPNKTTYLEIILKSNEENRIEDVSKEEGNKDTEKDNENKKEEIDEELKNNSKKEDHLENDVIQKEEISTNYHKKEENGSNNEILESEELPNTSNYLQKYYRLFVGLMLIGLLLHKYEKI